VDSGLFGVSATRQRAASQRGLHQIRRSSGINLAGRFGPETAARSCSVVGMATYNETLSTNSLFRSGVNCFAKRGFVPFDSVRPPGSSDEALGGRREFRAAGRQPRCCVVIYGHHGYAAQKSSQPTPCAIAKTALSGMSETAVSISNMMIPSTSKVTPWLSFYRSIAKNSVTLPCATSLSVAKSIPTRAAKTTITHCVRWN
jgi:hypothetical protein